MFLILLFFSTFVNSKRQYEEIEAKLLGKWESTTSLGDIIWIHSFQDRRKACVNILLDGKMYDMDCIPYKLTNRSSNTYVGMKAFSKNEEFGVVMEMQVIVDDYEANNPTEIIVWQFYTTMNILVTIHAYSDSYKKVQYNLDEDDMIGMWEHNDAKKKKGTFDVMKINGDEICGYLTYDEIDMMFICRKLLTTDNISWKMMPTLHAIEHGELSTMIMFQAVINGEEVGKSVYLVLWFFQQGNFEVLDFHKSSSNTKDEWKKVKEEWVKQSC